MATIITDKNEKQLIVEVHGKKDLRIPLDTFKCTCFSVYALFSFTARFLKGEIFAVGDEKENTEQQAFEAEAETAGLLEKIEMLEE